MCPEGYELFFEMLISQSESFFIENVAGFTKEEFVGSAAGLATCGYLQDYPDVLVGVEEELKKRISSLSPLEAIYLLKAFILNNSGSLDGIYKVIERHIGVQSDHLTFQEAAIVLRMYNELKQLESDFDP
jgi:hypothetical protein